MTKFQDIAEKVGKSLSPRVKGRKQALKLVNDLATTCDNLDENLNAKMREIAKLRTEKENLKEILDDKEKSITDLGKEADTLFDEKHKTFVRMENAQFSSSVKTFIILGLVAGYVLSIIF